MKGQDKDPLLKLRVENENFAYSYFIILNPQKATTKQSLHV